MTPIKPVCLTIRLPVRAQWFWPVVLMFFPVAGSFGATISAPNASLASVQVAVNSAADGDTVLVPAGSAVWLSALNVSKGVQVVGAGIDKTVITTGAGGALVNLTPNGKHAQLSGFTFNDVSSPDHFNGLLVINDGVNWRVCSNKFNLFFTGIHTLNDTCYGLIDHCTFLQLAANGSANGVVMSGTGDGTSSWDRAAAWGTTNYVYIEDCAFGYLNPGNGAYDAYGGARYVFRHNSVTNTWVNHHGCDSGGYRSTHSFEIYNNLLTSTINLAWFFEFRGGSGTIFSNACVTSSSANNTILLRCYRVFNTYSPWGSVTGFNPYDGNTDLTGYPALDQPGRTSPTTFLAGKSVQSLAPIYCWGNVFNGAAMAASAGNYANAFGGGSEAQLIQANRDYFSNTPKPGYVPLSYPHPLAIGVVPGPSTNPVIALSRSSLDFGSVPAGSNAELTLTVQNIGAGLLAGAATTAAPFSIVSGSSYSLGSNQTQVVRVRYSPVNSGAQSGVLTCTGGGGAIATLNGLTL